MIAAKTQLGYVNGVRYSMRKVSIADGEAGIRQTIRHMQAYVNGPEGIGSPVVRAQALDVVCGSPKSQEIQRVFEWVKNNIEFRGEAEETLQTPLVTLQMRAGDCDCQTVLIAALLKSLGYEVQLKTVAVQRDDPTLSTHVYAVVKDQLTHQWIPLDTTVRSAIPGWEPSDITRSTMYRVNKPLGIMRPRPLDPRPRVPRYRAVAMRGIHGMRGRRTLRSLRDDLVPAPDAPAGLSPGAQVAFDLAAPFTQAFASRIAYGTVPNIGPGLAAATVGTSQAFGTGSSFLWVMGIGLIVIGGLWVVTRNKK